MSSQPTMTTIQARLAQVCWKNEAFRKELFANPKATLEKYAERKFADDVKVFVHATNPKEIHLRILDKPAQQELSDTDLEKVSGGELFFGIPGPILIGSLVDFGQTQRRHGW